MGLVPVEAKLREYMKIFKNDNLEILAATAFDQLKSTIEHLALSNEHVTIALSGGSSVSEIYKQIAVRADELPKETWSKVIFSFADERVVPLESDDSNYKFAKEQFLDELISGGYICEGQIIKIDVESNAPHLEYAKELSDKIDIALLGVGPDAHTCSLFPNHSSTLNESTEFILVENSPKPPSTRISLSRSMLKSIPYPFAFFIGEGKRDAYLKFTDDKSSYNEAPIKIIQDSVDGLIFTNLS